MRPLLTALTILAVPVTLAAQQNPFKQTKPSIGKFEVTSELSGDMKGTVTAAMDGDRMVRRASDSVKMMGRTTKTESWSLTTRDSVYSADLTKKTGTVAPNLLPALATAYDQHRQVLRRELVVTGVLRASAVFGIGHGRPRFDSRF